MGTVLVKGGIGDGACIFVFPKLLIKNEDYKVDIFREETGSPLCPGQQQRYSKNEKS
ncbi:MAG: hypothetical protein MUP22_10560 [Desulfobacterales bacterium]|nr:hypothetical protein [Desulfobacterales bacterium]